MRLLVAYDTSPAARAAVDQVLNRPWPAGSEVRLVMVLDWPPLFPPPEGAELVSPLDERLLATQREQAEKHLQGVRERFRARPELTLSHELREGIVEDELLAAAREWKADLMFAGTHGKSALARLVVGSVCHALVSDAPCNVEVIRPVGGAPGA